MIRGSCLCGAVTIEVDPPLEHAAEACHCTRCRKQTGHFYVGVNVRRSSLRVIGEEHVTWYRSSESVERGFCAHCGSTLFWKPTLPGYQWTSVALGCLDGAVDLRIAKHTFVRDKGGYYEIGDEAPQSDGF